MFYNIRLDKKKLVSWSNRKYVLAGSVGVAASSLLLYGLYNENLKKNKVAVAKVSGLYEFVNMLNIRMYKQTTIN